MTIMMPTDADGELGNQHQFVHVNINDPHPVDDFVLPGDVGGDGGPQMNMRINMDMFKLV